MKVKEIRATLARIAKDPRLLDMSTWGRQDDCGTIACFAGHTILHHEGHKSASFGGCGLTAGRILGLSTCQSVRLFFLWNWPKSFQRAYARTTLPDDSYIVLKNRVEHFIKTRGRE